MKIQIILIEPSLEIYVILFLLDIYDAEKIAAFDSFFRIISKSAKTILIK